MGGKLRESWQFLCHSPVQVKLSMLVMGLGQLCYGQIVKGLAYLSSLALIIMYFVMGGMKNLIGFFTLGTEVENLWLGIEGDNSLTMLILGLVSIFILIFAIVIYVSNVKDIIFTANEVKHGLKPRNFRRSLLTMADDKFYATALVLPVIGVCIFTVLPIVFMICMAFTNLGGDIIHPKLADWSLSAWERSSASGR